MHLKTLTLRGFKSFASATSLELEPGVTCVVGPNGSGKSNVVDALAWVMGEQGAKSLRGGKMEDVIFAGTGSRPALGRAEVQLTIDNTDGALPIDYTEVSISRTLFRNGGSEYAINGSPCRLLDIQDLLSDSGLGREMHVIVGQGQLDAILTATPEERRGFIEEAAGVLKHRKRKERALRKLDTMQANLTRLTDLTTEIRRQLGPLAKQADVARRAQVVQAELRDAKARLLADELVQLTSALEAEIADETALRDRRGEVETQLATARGQMAELERTAAAAAPEISEASEVWFRLSSLRERLRGTATLAAERSRLLGQVEPEQAGTDPEDLQRQADRVREAETELLAEVDLCQVALEAAIRSRTEAEEAAEHEERRLAAAMRAVADRREGLARLAGAVAAARSKVEARETEIERLRQTLSEVEATGQQARSEFTTLETQVAGVEAGEETLDADHEAAVEAVELASAELDRLRTEQQQAETDKATWAARREALELSLARKDGAGVLLADDGSVPGVIGSVSALLEIENGYEEAIAAALGPMAGGVAVESVGAAVDAIRHLRTDDAGRAGLLIATDAGPTARPEVALGEGRWAAELVQCPSHLRAAIELLLHNVVAVGDLAQARQLVLAHPDLTAVTTGGDLLSAGRADGGSSGSPSVLQVQALLDEAAQRHEAAVAECERLRFALSAAAEAQQVARARSEQTLAVLNESDAKLAAVAERLGHLGAAARAAGAEADRVRHSLATAEEAMGVEQAKLAELTERLETAQDMDDEPAEQDADERDRLAAVATAARSAETEARLTLRTSEERARALAGRAESLEQAAAKERAAREAASQRAARREQQSAIARAVGAGAQQALAVLEHSLAKAQDWRREVEAARTERDAALAAQRELIDNLSSELAKLTDVVHRDEVARAQQRLRIEGLEQRAIDDVGMDPETLIAEFGPDLMVPPAPPAPGDPEPETPPEPVPYVRAEQEKRLRRCERALSLLGRVNPLALEEYAALDERHRFLVGQLNDLKKSRTDLMEVVREVDERVERVFTEAYRDTEKAFNHVFDRLFPGGEGHLVLTEPDNMLTTGIDIAARPAGKQVKRLSLLSGGERSLVAVAFMVAIFHARPSPFYVMDEVEAALDDTNLGRLLEIFRELKETSQIIIVTHQKRTMEIADALYGVTMRGDGVTTVISQRLHADDQVA